MQKPPETSDLLARVFSWTPSLSTRRTRDFSVNPSKRKPGIPGQGYCYKHGARPASMRMEQHGVVAGAYSMRKHKAVDLPAKTPRRRSVLQYTSEIGIRHVEALQNLTSR
ncbi:unnamed protein product [Phytophthora fragariaefolia]|uniref:Unnamed protein product n=1 Tax=Phytophthora fragariaefolia TaxID=1490495 RepID=A0A9W6XRF4_9STRA|nr:unnamed protein product [Phytophthora fragariaefolia]